MSADCYVGVKACGCAVAAMVPSEAASSQRRKEDARTIADWMRSGLSIERHSVEWVRANLHKCRCAAEAVGVPQPDLFPPPHPGGTA